MSIEDPIKFKADIDATNSKNAQLTNDLTQKTSSLQQLEAKLKERDRELKDFKKGMTSEFSALSDWADKHLSFKDVKFSP